MFIVQCARYSDGNEDRMTHKKWAIFSGNMETQKIDRCYSQLLSVKIRKYRVQREQNLKALKFILASRNSKLKTGG